MSTNTPRGAEFIRAAIAGIEDLGELARLREFAREQWADDDALWAELEAMFERREAEIEARPWTQLPLPLDEYEELDRDAG
jgi:hypothetical protein